MPTSTVSVFAGFIEPFVLARIRRPLHQSSPKKIVPLSARLISQPDTPPLSGATRTPNHVRALCAIAASLILQPSPSLAKNLLSENTIFRRYLITDSSAVLRYALPLPGERLKDPSPAPIRLVQEQLEKLGVHLRARGVAGIIAGRRDVEDLLSTLAERQLDILLDVPAARRQIAANKLSKLETTVADIQQELGTPAPVLGEGVLPRDVLRAEQSVRDAFMPRNNLKKITNYDAAYLEVLRTTALRQVGDIEEIATEGAGLPFRIPRRYDKLPRLLGRAQVEFQVQKKSGEWIDQDKKPLGSKATLMAVLDGYSAPITAGNFFDLVQRGYYDGTRILARQRDFYTQLGEREGDDMEGFIDPTSGRRREIPLEILPMNEPAPVYGATLDDLGIGDLQPALPVSAFGALAMVHSVENANDASSQFYFFMLDPNSAQARSFGGSVLTGSLATFGYVVDGKDLLAQLESGDVITSVRVLSGESNFKPSG